MGGAASAVCPGPEGRSVKAQRSFKENPEVSRTKHSQSDSGHVRSVRRNHNTWKMERLV